MTSGEQSAVDWAFEQKAGSAAAKLVLLVLAHQGWACCLSQAEIALEAEMSPASVGRVLKGLESLGLVRREAQRDKKGHRAADRYVLEGPGSQHVNLPSTQIANQADCQVRRLPTSSDLPTRQSANYANCESNKDSPTESLFPEGGVGGAASPAVSQRAQPKASRRKPETHIPDIFPVTAGMRAWARQHKRGFTIDVDIETEKFINHAKQHGRRCRDWNAAWRNWILNAQGYADRDKQRSDSRRIVVEDTRSWDV